MFNAISTTDWDCFAGALPFACGAVPLYAAGEDTDGDWVAVCSPESMEIYAADAVFSMPLNNATLTGAKHWCAAFMTGLTNFGTAAKAAREMGFTESEI